MTVPGTTVANSCGTLLGSVRSAMMNRAMFAQARAIRLTVDAVMFSESHHLNNGNALVSGVESELFGEVSLPAGFTVPNQYRSDRVLDLLP